MCSAWRWTVSCHEGGCDLYVDDLAERDADRLVATHRAETAEAAEGAHEARVSLY